MTGNSFHHSPIIGTPAGVTPASLAASVRASPLAILERWAQDSRVSTLKGARLLCDSMREKESLELHGVLAQTASATLVLASAENGERRTVKFVRSPDGGQQARATERFENSIALLCDVEHPSLVKPLAAGCLEGIPYLVSQYASGTCMADLLFRRGAPLPWDVALPIVGQVCEGLEVLHRRGIAHLDVKPQNLVLASDGAAKIIDFDSVRNVEDRTHLNPSRPMRITPAYVAPELAAGKWRIDIRSDIYSLGITLFEMLSGETPFVGASSMKVVEAHVKEQLPSLLQKQPMTPFPVAAVVVRAAHKLAERRYSSAAAMGAALLKVSEYIDHFGGAAPLRPTFVQTQLKFEAARYPNPAGLELA